MHDEFLSGEAEDVFGLVDDFVVVMTCYFVFDVAAVDGFFGGFGADDEFTVAGVGFEFNAVGCKVGDCLAEVGCLGYFEVGLDGLT